MRKYSHALIICSLMAILSLALARTLVSAGPPEATPVGTAFTYQGQLKDGSGNPITNTCDLQFSLYDALTSGVQIGSTQTVTGVTVANGYFTSSLDFGPGAFGGDARWLEIAVRCPAGGGGYTTLTPRQPLTPAPYSLYALNAGLLDNLPSTSFQQHYQNLVVVAKSGGDFTMITDALNSITTAGATNRFLVYVAPGTYTETVTMKQYVDIEGAGELATKITYAGSASPNTGTVIGASNAEMRFLTVENTGVSSYAIAIYNSGPAGSPHLIHITATASGATSENAGVYNYNSSSPTMTNVTASAFGGTRSDGVYNSGTPPTMTMEDVTATASGATTYNIGVYSQLSSSPTMTNVIATGLGGGSSTNYGVDTSSSSPTITNVTATASGGADNIGAANYSCSPTMTNVIATASGGTNSYGVLNEGSSSPMMTNVTATASGTGTNIYGVYNHNSSSPTMTNVTATASGPAVNNYGVYNYSGSSPTIQSSVIVASGGTSNWGIYNTGSSSSTVKVNNSRISAGTPIYNPSGFTAQVGASQLEGGAVLNGGNLTCVFSYDGSLNPLSSGCTYP